MSIKQNTSSLQEVLNIVNNLPEASTGVELPELSNEGSASDLLSGKELIDGEGNVVTGTIPTNTASNLTVSGATVTVPSGYYATQATKSVATATQATPSISVDSNGLITATATQTAGYVSAGSKSATKQLTTQAAKTITPTMSDQTAVDSGVYTLGAVTVKGDTNLVAENIAEGKTIFGITGTHSGSSGGIDTFDATATADKLFLNETAYVDNEKITGTFTIDNELTTQDDLIAQIQTALSNKVIGVVLPELTNPATAENLEEGYELIDGDGNIVVGTHVCDSGGGDSGEDGEGYYIYIQHNLPVDEFVANGVICPADTTTKILVNNIANLVSFYFLYFDAGIEDISVAYETEGDFGVETVDASVSWSSPSGQQPFYYGITDSCNSDETLIFNITTYA